jgi:hypothetical protein
MKKYEKVCKSMLKAEKVWAIVAIDEKLCKSVLKAVKVC